MSVMPINKMASWNSIQNLYWILHLLWILFTMVFIFVLNQCSQNITTVYDFWNVCDCFLSLTTLILICSNQHNIGIPDPSSTGIRRHGTFNFTVLVYYDVNPEQLKYFHQFLIYSSSKLSTFFAYLDHWSILYIAYF